MVAGGIQGSTILSTLTGITAVTILIVVTGMAIIMGMVTDIITATDTVHITATFTIIHIIEIITHTATADGAVAQSILMALNRH